MPEYVHPVSHAPVRGTLVEAPEKIEEGDLYPDIDGSWQPCSKSMVGQLAKNNDSFFWIRPKSEQLSVPDATKTFFNFATSAMWDDAN